MKASISLRECSTASMLFGTFLTFLMFYPRSVSETMDGVDAVRLLRGVTLSAILGIGLVVTLVRFQLGWIHVLVRGPFVWYVLYVAWALASVAFSGDAFLSAAKVFELCVTVFVVATVTHWCSTAEELDQIWRMCMAGLGLIVVGYFAVSIALTMPLISFVDGFPKYSGFGGGPGGANGMSQISALLALFGISRSLHARTPGSKVAFWSLTVLALLALVVSYSRTSLAIFALLLLLLLARSRRYVALLLACGAVLAGVLALGPELYRYILRGQSAQVFLSLTGRLDYLWVAGLSVWASSPWIGHGYYYATTYLLPLALVDGYDITLSNVDNTFLEIAMNLGVVGLSLFVALWLSLGRRMARLVRTRPELWRVPMVRESVLVVLSTFIRSWVNPTIAYHHWNTVTFLVAVVILTRAVDIPGLNLRVGRPGPSAAPA